jgi:hypothetical protein
MRNPAERPNYQQVKAMIKQFTGQANTLVIPRVFIDFTGDHLAAMLLSQILYWSDRTSDPDGWFYKTADEWDEEIGLSNFQIKRATAILKAMGVETRLKRVDGAPRTHYRVDMDAFIDLFFKFLENRETRKSRNDKMENQETSKSDFQETEETYKEQRLHAEITSKRESENHDNAVGSRSLKNGTGPKPKQRDPLALAIAAACRINPDYASKRQKENLNEAYLSLRDRGATPEDIPKRVDWWQQKDWRAREEPGRPITPIELIEVWDMVAEPARPPPVPANGKPVDNRPSLQPFQPQSRTPTNGAKLRAILDEKRRTDDNTS